MENKYSDREMLEKFRDMLTDILNDENVIIERRSVELEIDSKIERHDSILQWQPTEIIKQDISLHFRIVRETNKVISYEKR